MGAPVGEVQTYSYQEFCNFVRRFDQTDLLTTVARNALSSPARAGDPSFVRTAPWALAGLVKASICHGNMYRSRKLRPKDIDLGVHMFHNLNSGELDDPELRSALGILVRVGYEQFPYQESIFEELTRAEALFGNYSGRKALEVLSESAINELYGAPLRQAVGVAFLLHASAQANSGFFDPSWLSQRNFTEVLKILPADTVIAVINAAFSTTFEGFRERAAMAPALPYLDKYMFNPLMARPFVQLPDGRLIAPVPQLIARRMSPLEFYYEGLARWGVSFTNDMGEIFEDYVGRQLKTLPDAYVLPEIEYSGRQGMLKSVDWIVIFKDLVLLIEAKATRAAAGTRAASTTLKASIDGTLGKAIRQLNTTAKAIRARVPEFAVVPIDRPMIGMVATLDSWYWSNSHIMRTHLPTPEIHTSIASSRDLETLIAIGQRRSAGKVLQEILEDEEKGSWQLGAALKSYGEQEDANPLLMAAWKKYPFGNN